MKKKVFLAGGIVAALRGPRRAPVLLMPLALFGLTCSVPEKERITRTYDVELAPGFAAPLLGLSGDRTETKRRESEEHRRSEEALHEAQGELKDLIRAEIGTLGGTNEIDLAFDGSALRVTATSEQHDEVKRVVDSWSAERKALVSVETLFLAVDELALPGLTENLQRFCRAQVEAGLTNSADRQSPPELPPELTTWLSPMPLPATGPFTVRHAPTITVPNHQLAHSLVVSQSAMIVDVKFSEVEGQRTAEPVIEVLSTGVVVEVKAREKPDQKAIDLDLWWQSADHTGPSNFAVVEGFPLEMPQLSWSQYRVLLSVPRGRWAPAGGLARTLRDARGAEVKKEIHVVLVKADVVGTGEG